MNITLATPVFLRFAAGAGEPQKNRALNESVAGASQPSDSPSGQAGWSLAQWPRFLDENCQGNHKQRKFKKRKRGMLEEITRLRFGLV